MAKTFVLLHGAWHGGWCWERVAGPLRARGHRVTTPTQTGLGERRHLISADLTLETFGEDVVQHLIYEDLTDAVLVGHSFGGNGISYAAEHARGRIASLVYLDCTILYPGERMADRLPAAALADRIASAEASGGVGVAPPDPEVFGVRDAADKAWVSARMTPHPLSTMLSPAPLRDLPGAGMASRYIACRDPAYQSEENLAGMRARLGWQIEEIATGHDAMVTAPDALVEMLDR